MYRSDSNNYDSNSNHNSKKSSDEEINRNLCPSVLICENLCYDNAIDGGSRPVSVTIGATFSLMKETFMENYSPDFSRANAQLALMAQPTNGGYFTFQSEKDIIAENLRNHRGLYYSDNRGAAEREAPSSNQGDDRYSFGKQWENLQKGAWGNKFLGFDYYNDKGDNTFSLIDIIWNDTPYMDSIVYPANGPKMLQVFQDSKGDYFKVQIWKGTYPWTNKLTGIGCEVGIYKWYPGGGRCRTDINNDGVKENGDWMPYTALRGGGNFQIDVKITDKISGFSFNYSEKTWWNTAFNSTISNREWYNLDMGFRITGLDGWSDKWYKWEGGQKLPVNVFK